MPAPYFRTLILRFWRLIALCALGVGLGVAVASYVLFPVYEATALIQVQMNAAISVFTADTIAHNEATLATSSSILLYAARRNPPLTEATLKTKVTAAAIANSQMVEIIVEDKNGARAASVANTIAAALVSSEATVAQNANTAAQQPTRKLIAATQSQIASVNQQLQSLGTPPSNQTQANTLQAQLTSLQKQLTQEQTALQQIQINQAGTTILLRVAQPAEAPSKPLTTRIVESGLAGVFGGAMLGLLLALALDLLDWRVRSAAEVQSLLGADVLGEITGSRLTDGDDGLTEATYSGLQETFQALSRSLDFLGIAQPLRVIAILSPERTRASQALASGLAISLAASERRILLVDCHLANGRQSKQFGIPQRPGLSDAALAARGAAESAPAPITYAHQPTSMRAPNLLALPSGSPPPNPEQTLASPAMARVLAALPQSGAEVTLLDAPPLLGRVGMARGAQALLRHVDGVLIVVDLARTRKDHLLLAQSLLATAEARVLGCLVAGAPEQTPRAVTPPATPTAERGAAPRGDAIARRAAPTQTPTPPPTQAEAGALARPVSGRSQAFGSPQ